MELTSNVVGYVYKTYLYKLQIQEAHFRRPMLPVNAAVWLGLKAQTGFQVVWDVAFGCWAGCVSCWVPGLVCVAFCVDDKKDERPKCYGCCVKSVCAPLCGFCGRINGPIEERRF